MDRTIIYYTANKEDEKFEAKIRQGILDVKGDLPIISVSQKPIDFGENICVGDIGNTYLNAFRQLLIGCEKATTPYVVMTEADFLYPKIGYFDFIPTDPNVIYSYDNVWILYKNRDRFYRKERTHGSIIYGREFLINLLKTSLKDKPMWSRTKVNFPYYRPEHHFEPIHGENPIISIKTGDGVQKSTRLMNVHPRKDLDYWGTAIELRRRIFE